MFNVVDMEVGFLAKRGVITSEKELMYDNPKMVAYTQSRWARVLILEYKERNKE